MKKTAVSVISVCVLISVWWICSICLGASVILPSPYEVVKELFRIVTSESYLKNVLATVTRALVSFLIIVFSGVFLGLVAGRFKTFEWFFQPLVTVFKATPVMSVILIAFIWMDTGKVPVFSAFLMGFPVMFVQVVNGVHSIDVSLLQMCSVYHITGAKKLFNFTIPAVAPSIVTGAKQTLSMIWKVIIAAEVLTIPRSGIGRSLQLAQVKLETAEVFAWTVTAVILTAAGDFALKTVLKKIVSRRCSNET